MTAQTPIFGIKYIQQGEPARNTRQALEDNAVTIEAALVRGGIAPPAAQDLATLAGRVSALEIGGEVNTTTASGALGSSAIDIPGTLLNFTAPSVGTLYVNGTFDFQLSVPGDLLAGYLNVDGTDRGQAVVVQGISRCTVSRSWRVPLAAGEHAIKLRAMRATGTGTADNTQPLHTGFSYRFVAAP
jgi:hypothetical protein